MKTEYKKYSKYNSGELVEALKTGKSIVRDVDDEYFPAKETTKLECGKLFVYGWGSALGDGIDRLMHAFHNPEYFNIED